MSPNILSGCLRINDLTPSDALAFFEYRSHAEVARFQSWVPESVSEVQTFIVRNLAIPFNQDNSWYQLAIRSAMTHELLGDLGVHFPANDCHQVEIGVTIAPWRQRQGLGKSAVGACLDYLFTVLNKHRVFASVDPCNEASRALLRSVGMRQEGHFRQSLFWKGKWVDDVVFGLLRSEWKDRAGAPERPNAAATVA